MRLENYAVNLNINDRYTTIRDELANKGKQDPFTQYESWNDKKLPNIQDNKAPDWRKFQFGNRRNFFKCMNLFFYFNMGN